MARGWSSRSDGVTCRQDKTNIYVAVNQGKQTLNTYVAGVFTKFGTGQRIHKKNYFIP